MPGYSSNPGPAQGGSDDMLSDAPDAAPQEEKAPEAPETDSQTALVPESLCPGMKPGEEMVVKIEEVQDGQYLISYAPEKGKESAAGSAPEGGGEYGGDKEMASMME